MQPLASRRSGSVVVGWWEIGDAWGCLMLYGVVVTGVQIGRYHVNASGLWDKTR